MEFPPLAAYGAIGNDDRVALVSRDGSIDWCCFPHLESPSVFARNLDLDRGGHFAIHPTTPYDTKQRYVDRTNVLETVFETDDGRAVLTDVMPLLTEEDENETLHDRYQESIYRKVACEEGSVEFEVSFAPRFDYGRAETTFEQTTEGILARGDDEHLYLHADLDMQVETDVGTATVEQNDVGTATVELGEGEKRWFAVQYDHDQPHPPNECERLLDGTVAFWRTWLDDCERTTADLYEGAWGPEVRRSALVLKLLIHDETGAIPAAATASIPEEIGGDRNWDYRFNWIRDAKFTVQALYNLGQNEEAHDYFTWFLDHLPDDPAEIKPLYGLHGETDLEEEILDHFSGYRNSTPVRVGNAAAFQQQNDVYGTIVQGIYETVRHDEALDDDAWTQVCNIVDYVTEVWDEPDVGIWEFRDDPRHFVHSKLLCWVALDRGIALAEKHGRDAPLERWKRTREAVHDEVLEHGYSEEAGSFVQYYDTDAALDATALLIPVYGFLPPEDDRVQSTIDAVRDRLTTDEGLVVRFVDSDVRPDETTGFVICSFWLVDAHVLSGNIEEAERVFRNVLACTTPLGLFSEKFDPDDEHLGNFPQAYSHIGLINSAIYLTKAKEGEQSGGLEPEEFGEVDTMFEQPE